MRLVGAEQNAIGYNNRRPAAALQEAQEEGKEQQLGLAGVDDAGEPLGDRLGIQVASEGRIGENKRIGLSLFTVFLGKGIAVDDRRILEPV